MKQLLIVCSMLLVALAGVPAYADDCVDVELGFNVISGDPHDILTLYFSAENCGTETATVTFTVTLSVDQTEFGTVTFDVPMPAGELFVRELQLPVL